MSRGFLQKADRFILVAAAVLVALLIAELLARAFVPQVGWRAFEDRYLGWSSRHYRLFDPGADPVVDGQARVLFLGDSNLAGSGVSSLAERFPIVMRDMAGGRYAVRILASGGWGTDQELLAFIGKGIGWQPDLVVLTFTPTNDLGDILSNQFGGDGKAFKPYYVLEEEGELQLYSPLGAPIEDEPGSEDPGFDFQVYLLDLFRSVMQPQASRSRPDPAEATEQFADVDPRYLGPDIAGFNEKLEQVESLTPELSWTPQAYYMGTSTWLEGDYKANTYQWGLLEAVIGRLKQEVERSGARLVVMLLPIPFAPQDARMIPGSGFEFTFSTPDGPITFRTNEPGERLTGICGRLEITCFDSTADFIRRVSDDGLLLEVWPDTEDRHPSELGHQLLAELVLEFLEAEESAGRIP